MNRTDIPNEPHYAIIVIDSTSVHIPGDERSRTAPGHGYPERTETYDVIQYKSFPSTPEGRQQWEKILKDLYVQEHNKGKVVGFHVDQVAKPTIRVEVDL